MSHLQQESHPGHELSTYEELPVYNYSTEIEELSMAVEISKYKEPSVPEELSVYKPLPVNQVLPVSEEALPPPPPLWTLRVLYLCGILAVIGVALMLFEIALGMFPIMIHVIRSLFGESTCDGYTANEWYKGGYDVVYNEALATASNNKYATIKRRHKSDTPTIVEIPGLPATVPVSARCETPENKLHTQDQGEEVSPTTVVGTTDIMAKDSILEESGLTENELQLEGREDINPQEKKEEGLPPPYARVCEVNKTCPLGYRCLDATCVRGCDSTDDCPDGYHCKYGRYGYRCFEKMGRHRECMEHGHFCRRNLECCTGYCRRRAKGGDFLCTPKPGGVDGHADGFEK